jgi:hypothetical protein
MSGQALKAQGEEGWWEVFEGSRTVLRIDGVRKEWKQTKRMLILDTHFSIESHRVKPHYVLSPMTSNESQKGR